MTAAEANKRMMRTEQDIITMIGDCNAEDLFWLRVDLGMRYLLNRHTYAEAQRIWLKPSYWKWLRTVWHINDRQIISELRRWGFYTVEWWRYAHTQQAKLESFEITQDTLRTIINQTHDSDYSTNPG